jgi:hypothetical protein
MASINQLVSEFAHSISQPNNQALRENLRSLIVHTRNEIIRRSYENHNYLDAHLQYRYKVSLTDVFDGDQELPDSLIGIVPIIKRSLQKVPRPVRLINNLPFHRVSTVGYKNNIVIPYVKETCFQYTSSIPGMCGIAGYDYINDYLYIFSNNQFISGLNSIIIQAAFEHPTEVAIESGEGAEYNYMNDDDEWFLPEDMIGQMKEIIYKRDMLNNRRETNEVPNTVLVQ